MDNLFFVILIAAVVVGLVMTCAALLHIKRQGGFQQAMALTSEGKWPLGRYLFAGALACFGVALLVQIYTFLD